MCFVINKDYAEEFKMKSMRSDFIGVGEPKSSSANIADHVAVHESGVRNVVKTGQGSALVETAMTPQVLGDKKMNAKANLVNVVSKCVDEVLKKHKVKNEDKRMEIAMDVCDEILRFLDNPSNYKKKNG